MVTITEYGTVTVRATQGGGNANGTNTTFTMGASDATATATGLPGTAIPISAASRTEPFIGWTFDSSGVEVGAFQNSSSAQTIFTLGNNSAGIRANYANAAQNLRVTGGHWLAFWALGQWDHWTHHFNNCT